LGVYFLDDSDASVANWVVKKLSGDYGATSPHSLLNILDDIKICNTFGTITSAIAVESFGDVESADLFHNMRVEDTIRQKMSQEGGNLRHSMYFAEGKIAYFTYKSSGGTRKDRIVKMNFNEKIPEITIIEKDLPNCFGQRRDNQNILRPYYGAEDGYIYSMEEEDRDVAASGYTGTFQTPHMDMSGQSGDLKVKTIQKQFDFVEIYYEPAGDWNLTVDVWIDGIKHDSFTVSMAARARNLNVGEKELGALVLGTSTLAAGSPYAHRQRIGGQGRTISIKCSNAGNGQNFAITNINIYFRPLANQQASF
jgi:hypothetical protein